ncbi:type II toxin-antitoxin system CcdA family antitoxin [Roseicyclus mahoneyensis]|uniref:Post-segregation antitoxin (Ccd killing protein) n=1 Tax=Roseicyclus mahoneyensis TaxID=164332 RepID=A0A316GI00_9RHOB|nr:type II toxin-antitoxin system CcdA family antitoxin [Roseicyclus mahoneyensis]PWK59618.1 post-segregation antitoxin (ccd killing protein) [Roseicyclus mahoneyensis]
MRRICNALHSYTTAFVNDGTKDDASILSAEPNTPTPNAPTPTRVTLSTAKTVLAAAKDAGLTLSRRTEEALAAAAKAERNRRWTADNRDGIEAHNRHVAEHGLLLETYRTF